MPSAGPLLGDRFVHAPSQFLLDPPERCPHAIAPCCSFDKELTTTVAFTDEGKAKKVEGLRFSEPAMSASFRRKAAELDQAGLVRIERQRERHGEAERIGNIACGQTQVRIRLRVDLEHAAELVELVDMMSPDRSTALKTPHRAVSKDSLV